MTPDIRCRPIGYYAIRNDPEFQQLLVGTEQIGLTNRERMSRPLPEASQLPYLKETSTRAR